MELSICLLQTIEAIDYECFDFFHRVMGSELAPKNARSHVGEKLRNMQWGQWRKQPYGGHLPNISSYLRLVQYLRGSGLHISNLSKLWGKSGHFMTVTTATLSIYKLLMPSFPSGPSPIISSLHHQL